MPPLRSIPAGTDIISIAVPTLVTGLGRTTHV
jgi:hypothetical protein